MDKIYSFQESKIEEKKKNDENFKKNEEQQ